MRDEEDSPTTKEFFDAETRWMKRQCELVLERDLKEFETNLIMFRNHCQICYRIYQLTPCIRCHIISFCESHQSNSKQLTQKEAFLHKHHQENFCEMYQLTLECAQLQAKEKFPFLLFLNEGIFKK